MAEYIANIHGKDLHIEYTYIPAQQEKYPDTEPLRSHVEIDKIYVTHKDPYNKIFPNLISKVDITDIMLECADDWLINLESEIIEKLEG